MGFKLSYIAIKGKNEEEILSQMSLKIDATKFPADNYRDNDFIGTELTNGWYLIVDTRFELIKYVRAFELLSHSAVLLTCGIVDTTNYAFASKWKDGKCVWSIENNCDNYPETALTVVGNPPESFYRLRDEADAKANAANEIEEEDQDDDERELPNYADLPSQLVAEQCDYLYYLGNAQYVPGTTKLLMQSN